MKSKKIVFAIATAGGELEISLANEGFLKAVYEAVDEGFVKVDAAGWGDRTIAKLTKQGRELTGLPVELNPLTRAINLLRRNAA